MEVLGEKEVNEIVVKKRKLVILEYIKWFLIGGIVGMICAIAGLLARK